MTERPEGPGEQTPDLNRVTDAVVFHVGILADAAREVLETVKPLLQDERAKSWSDLDSTPKEQLAHELCWTVELEQRGPYVGTAFILGGERVRDLQRSWDRFHDNLPFDAAELRWLNSAYLRAAGDDPDTWANGEDAEPTPNFVGRLGHIASRRGHIINRGHVVEVNGGELVERWWDWRRRAGDFTDRDAAGEAFEALRHVRDLATLIERRESE
ncbi:MAG: hypothetical protein ACRDLF_00740 [Solirubrobacteraceae bacterium]